MIKSLAQGHVGLVWRANPLAIGQASWAKVATTIIVFT